MNDFLEPLFAIIVIVIPMGLAYVIVMLQARNHRIENGKADNQKEP